MIRTSSVEPEIEGASGWMASPGGAWQRRYRFADSLRRREFAKVVFNVLADFRAQGTLCNVAPDLEVTVRPRRGSQQPPRILRLIDSFADVFGDHQSKAG